MRARIQPYLRFIREECHQFIIRHPQFTAIQPCQIRSLRFYQLNLRHTVFTEIAHKCQIASQIADKLIQPFPAAFIRCTTGEQSQTVHIFLTNIQQLRPEFTPHLRIRDKEV